MSGLSPAERDRLLLFTTAELARARRARGLRLNVVEATAIIADTVCEAARDGKRLAEAVAAGRDVLTEDDVLPGVVTAVPDVKVEATFDDGTRLAVVRDPFRAAPPAPSPAPPLAPPPAPPGGSDTQSARSSGLDCAIGTLEGGGGGGGGGGGAAVTVTVTNTADVPIAVTSHFHFFEANPRLRFDRAVAYGTHLAIEAGAAIRFEPGNTQTVSLAPIRGRRVVIGFAGLVDGPLDEPGAKQRALKKARACGYEGS